MASFKYEQQPQQYGFGLVYGVFGRRDLAALRGCHTLNIRLLVFKLGE
jgi:hypothetical protein